jgi:hypothetical protein
MVYGKDLTSRLPKDFQRYFWDVSFEDLTIEKYRGFITERILNYGDLTAIKWLLSWSDRQFIRALIENNRNLNNKTRNYWHLMLEETPAQLFKNER